MLRGAPAGAKTRIDVAFASSTADRHALARPEGAGEQPGVRDALARARPLDLEHATRDRRIRVALCAGEELGDAGEQLVDADAVRRRAEEHWMDDAAPRLLRQLVPQPGIRLRRLVVDERAKDRLVVLGEGLGERRHVGGVVCRERDDAHRPPAGVADPGHRDEPRREPARHRLDDAAIVGAGAVDLVDEDQRGDLEPLQGAEQERRLGLDALDGRDDQDRAVEHAEDAFDLGDEVGVAGRVDEVDREVADEERGDRGPDRDAAFAFELEGVGLGGAGVDAADVVDRAGGEEESFAEGGLTGVDVGEDSEIERAHGTSCLPRR